MATRKTAASRRSIPTHVYQLLVSLEEIEPKIWRRLWVPDTLTLAKLDRVIQAAMGWTNSHLHEFAIDGRRYGIVDPEWDQDADLLEDKRFRVGDVLGTRVQDFLYTYDFGDCWSHSVKVEQIIMAKERVNTWPMCLAGANACPPEDVGGTYGYMEFLQAMRDPTHEQHEALWLWSGGPFDPNGFDVNAANRAIRELKCKRGLKALLTEAAEPHSGSRSARPATSPSRAMSASQARSSSEVPPSSRATKVRSLAFASML